MKYLNIWKQAHGSQTTGNIYRKEREIQGQTSISAEN